MTKSSVPCPIRPGSPEDISKQRKALIPQIEELLIKCFDLGITISEINDIYEYTEVRKEIITKGLEE